MRRSDIRIIAFAGIILASLYSGISSNAQQFRHVESPVVAEKEVAIEEPDTLYIRTAAEIIAETPLPMPGRRIVNRVLAPWIFTGYRHIPESRITLPDSLSVMEKAFKQAVIEKETAEMDSLSRLLYLHDLKAAELPVMQENYVPDWLRFYMLNDRLQDDFMASNMMSDWHKIDYAYWDLPEPPRLPEDDVTFGSYIRRLILPDVDPHKAVNIEMEQQKRHWLHVFNTGLQFSQAYLSGNWYQGGNNYLALLFNFYWDVSLNQVYHPNLMFQSVLSYKLGLNSVEDDIYHKYSISQDNFQYNMKAGVKAFRNWFYSVNLQFKTQLLNNYPKDSQLQTASFLSPGDLTAGLGMTYNKSNEKKTLVFSTSISPISYNLKMCIDPMIDHEQFNIAPDRKYHNEIGSNAELTFKAIMGSHVSYSTRLFLFSDYRYFTGDWENTLNFQFNRFFSTQLYANLRYDSSVDPMIAPGWKKWMLKEILSVGLSYTFSTKE